MTSIATGTITVLDPTARPRELSISMALRPDDLRGCRVGFLWNSKPNGDALFSRLEELLREKYEITLTSHQRKPTASIPADQSIVDELAKSTDAVIVGLGD
jgi:hypothetical protein